MLYVPCSSWSALSSSSVSCGMWISCSGVRWTLVYSLKWAHVLCMPHTIVALFTWFHRFNLQLLPSNSNLPWFPPPPVTLTIHPEEVWLGALLMLMSLMSVYTVETHSTWLVVSYTRPSSFTFVLLSIKDNLVSIQLANSGTDLDVANLDICTPYWFVARAASCAAEAFSDPAKLELRDVTPFFFKFDLNDDSTCDDWIKIDVDGKISNTKSAMMDALDSTTCGFISVGCFANSSYTCPSPSGKTVVFR